MAEIGKDIQKARQLLEAGELVAIPTETVYGLAGNALDAKVVTKIFSVKNRPHFDPLIVHVPSLSHAEAYVESIPESARKLAAAFWPGPLTLLLPKKPIISDLVTSGLDRVGIRCPNHELTASLLQQLNFPLAAPSANPFRDVSPTLPEHVNEQLGDKIRYILDGGSCPVGIESTIVGFESDRVVIYRTGGLSLEKIQSVVGKVELQTDSTARPVAPGQLTSHYAPRKPVHLGDIESMLVSTGVTKVGVLCFQSRFEEVQPDHQIILSKNGNLEEAAQNLFSALRTLDKLDVKVILAEEVPDVGIGRAINDRLRRAAVK